MAKRPFRKFNSKDFVNAVQVTDENINELADLLGGLIEEDEAHPNEKDLLLPGIPSALVAHVGDYILQLKGNGRYGVLEADDFASAYRVPKPGTPDVDEDDEESEEE